jgi:hypothetical protein
VKTSSRSSEVHHHTDKEEQKGVEAQK